MKLTRRKRIALAPQDRELWQKLYYKHPKSYQRRRMNAIKLLWDGLKQIEVCEQIGCNRKTLHTWIDLYLSGGFSSLLSPLKPNKLGTGLLKAYHLRILKYIILHKSPIDYGKVGYRWTLAYIGELLVDKWQINLQKSRIQEILQNDLNLSYQKFHRDYGNADKGKQKAFAKDLNQRLSNQSKEEAIIWFDEFSISTRADTSYGWAERNSSPKIVTNEKKDNGIMDF